MSSQQHFAVLTKGSDHTVPWGQKFRRGQPTPVDESRLGYFQSNPRFQILVKKARGEEPVRALPQRSRARVRDDRAALASDPWVPEAQVLSEAERSRMLQLAQIPVDGRWGHRKLGELALEFGATEEELGGSLDSLTREDLRAAFLRVQVRVLSELQGGSVPSESDDVAPGGEGSGEE